jgi:hypothetical protein
MIPGPSVYNSGSLHLVVPVFDTFGASTVIIDCNHAVVLVYQDIVQVYIAKHLS